MENGQKRSVTTLADASRMDARYVTYLAWLERLQAGKAKAKKNDK